MARNYIQVYKFTEDGNELLQKNIFTPEPKLLMQTYIYDGDMEPREEFLLFELDYIVQEDKYSSLKRSLEKHFDNLISSSDNERSLIIEEEGKAQLRAARPGDDPLFERLFDKFTRIVSYSSIPSG